MGFEKGLPISYIVIAALLAILFVLVFGNIFSDVSSHDNICRNYCLQIYPTELKSVYTVFAPGKGDACYCILNDNTAYEAGYIREVDGVDRLVIKVGGKQ